jgi:SAM-dependent MidA family methyltransferase
VSVGGDLRARIAEDGPITFATFMDAALYDADGGFYARGHRLGPLGPFSTAPTLHAAFADAVAAEARAAHDALGRPERWRLVEAGPGDGTLARALAARLADLRPELVVVERASGMAALVRTALRGVPHRICGDARELAPADGIVVANEVFDALPFRLLRWPDEVLVDVGADGRFVEAYRPAPEPLLAALLAGGVEPFDGGRYAVTETAPALLRSLAAAVRRGRLLVLDYGGTAAEVHGGRRHPVRTFLGNHTGGDPLAAPGTQDLTADVDFDALRRAAAGLGLRELAYASQAAWLAGRGAVLPPLADRNDDGWRLARLLDPELPFRVLLLERPTS